MIRHLSPQWMLRPVATFLISLASVSAFAQSTIQAENQTQSLGRAQRATRGLATTPVRQLEVTAPKPEVATGDHPLFHTSYSGEDDRIVAKTAWGNVTARDLYLWLMLNDSETPAYILHTYDESKFTTDRKVLAEKIRAAINDYVFVNLAIPRLVTEPGCTSAGAWKEYIYTLPAYQYVYVARVIRPLIQILPADRQKFLQENKSAIADGTRYRVRYIFVPVAEDADSSARIEASAKLQNVRRELEAKKRSFADAAREVSQAPSASAGGEIPPFGRGEVFYGMEGMAESLKEGELSDVFPGPGGVYLMQLLQIIPGDEPSLENPKHAEKVDELLGAAALGARYRYELNKLLDGPRRPVLRDTAWDERADSEAVGEVDAFRLTKGQFWDLYPELEGDDLTLNKDYIRSTLRTILEREAMAQDVMVWKHQCDPVILRAKEMAANKVKRDCYVDGLEEGITVDEAKVREFWKSNPHLSTPLPAQRVIKLTLETTNIAPTPEQALEEMDRVAAAAREGQPLVSSPIETARTPVETNDTYPTVTTEPADAVTSGGAAPQSAAGGNAPVDDVVRKGEPKRWFPSGVAPSEVRSMSPYLEPANKMPLAPPTSLDAYKRIMPSTMKPIVEGYSHPDFRLSYADFGYVFADGSNGIPVAVAKVGKGGFTKPALEGNKVVMYYVEDLKRVPKPAFGDVRSHAYATYRKVENSRRTKQAMDREVRKANVRYTF